MFEFVLAIIRYCFLCSCGANNFCCTMGEVNVKGFRLYIGQAGWE